MTSLKLLTQHTFLNGHQRRYAHFSSALNQEAHFSLYLPPRALQGYTVPALYCLPSEHDSDEQFAAQSGAQRFAASWGIALIIVSPQLYAAPKFAVYLTQELPQLVSSLLIENHCGIMGHGIGANHALRLASAYPQHYAAVSAVSPIMDNAPLAPTLPSCPILMDYAAGDNAQEITSWANHARAVGINIQCNHRRHYDNSFYLLASFIDSHIEFHADALDL